MKHFRINHPSQNRKDEKTLPRPEVPYGMSILSPRRGNTEVRQALGSVKFSGVTD
jgi:hypothetical protein